MLVSMAVASEQRMLGICIRDWLRWLRSNVARKVIGLDRCGTVRGRVGVVFVVG